MDQVVKVIHVNIIPEETLKPPPAKKIRRRNRNGIVAKGSLVDMMPEKEIEPISQCSICKKYISTKHYQEHMAIHHPVLATPSAYGVYPCEVCKGCFSRRSDKELHFRHEHLATPLYYCAVCHSNFLQKQSFDLHRCSSLMPQLFYVCGCCGTKFTTADLFGRHVATAHKSKSQPFHMVQVPSSKPVTCPKPVQKKPEVDTELDPIVGDDDHEESVVVKTVAGRRIISKMKRWQIREMERKRRKKGKIKVASTSDSLWYDPVSPLPPPEPLPLDDFFLPSEVKVVRHCRSIGRLNSRQQIAAPDVIEMYQPSGMLLRDADHVEPHPEDNDFVLDEKTGILHGADGIIVDVEPEPADLEPFVDERIAQECCERLLEVIDHRNALPIFIGSQSVEAEQPSSISHDFEPTLEQPNFNSYQLDLGHRQSARAKRAPVTRQPITNCKDQQHVGSFKDPSAEFILDSEDENCSDDQEVGSVSINDQYEYIDHDQENKEGEQKSADVEIGGFGESVISLSHDDSELNGDDADRHEDFNQEIVDEENSDEGNRVSEDFAEGENMSGDCAEDSMKGVQVFSDEEGRLIIVQANGVTSVAPAGSQVVQIDTGEFIILQPTENGGTVAVPLGGEGTESDSHLVDDVHGSVAVVGEDGTVRFLLEDSSEHSVQGGY